MLSKYGRKAMLRTVATSFIDTDLFWLASQSEFNAACEEQEDPHAIIQVGKRLLRARKQPEGFDNKISIPPLLELAPPPNAG